MKLKKAFLIFAVLFCLANMVQAQSLFEAFETGDFESIRNKIELLEVDLKEKPYISEYLKGTKNYDSRVLQYLIEKGADVNKINEYGVGPLYYAIATNNIDAVNILINSKADVKASWKKPEKVYWEYDFGLSKDTVFGLPYYDKKAQKFITNSYDFTVRDRAMMSPLAAALYCKNPDITAALLSAGADPLQLLYSIKDNKGTVYTNTIFDHVIGYIYSNYYTLDYMYFYNAYMIWNAVMKLPESKRPKIEATIQDNGLISILNGSLKGVKKELSNGYIKASEMLPYAAITKNWEVVELLLKYNNIDINGTFDGQSLMSFAITYLYSDVVEFLLDHGACIPNRITPIRFNENDDYYGFGTTFTPIVWAVKNKKEPLVDVLIKNGVDVTDGEALLYSFHAPSIRNKLVAAGANINTIAEYYDESF